MEGDARGPATRETAEDVGVSDAEEQREPVAGQLIERQREEAGRQDSHEGLGVEE